MTVALLESISPRNRIGNAIYVVSMVLFKNLQLLNPIAFRVF